MSVGEERREVRRKRFGRAEEGAETNSERLNESRVWVWIFFD